MAKPPRRKALKLGIDNAELLHPSWVNLMRYVNTWEPNNIMVIKFVDGKPHEIVDDKKKLRFDREFPPGIQAAITSQYTQNGVVASNDTKPS